VEEHPPVQRIKKSVLPAVTFPLGFFYEGQGLPIIPLDDEGIEPGPQPPTRGASDERKNKKDGKNQWGLKLSLLVLHQLFYFFLPDPCFFVGGHIQKLQLHLVISDLLFAGRVFDGVDLTL
jgi:hypothetical protein